MKTSTNTPEITPTIKNLLLNKSVQERFDTLLGNKTQGFISSVLQIVNNSELLQKADPGTILNAAITAATLDLPINQNLGFAWIVPYKGKAQFQIGWKGFVQLALRTGQYRRINVSEVYKNQFKSYHRLTEELVADFDKIGEGDVVGYAAYFQLLNGMEKTVYWSREEVVKHAKKYSQTYGKSNSSGEFVHSPWNDADQFHAMAKKTVLKNTISKWGIMSIEMQTAQLADQSVQDNEGDFQYLDNESPTLEENNTQEEATRVREFIKRAKTIPELLDIQKQLSQEMAELLKPAFETRHKELTAN